MVDDTRYEPDYSGTGSLMQTDEMQAAMVAAATAGIQFARSISPDATPLGAGYIDNWEVSVGIERIARGRRAVAELANVSDYAVEVELGELGDVSSAETGHHVLARTADHIGSSK